MIKFRFLAVSALVAACLSAAAQTYSGHDHRYRPTKSALYDAEIESFALLYAQYNAVTAHTASSLTGGDHNALSAVTVGYSYYASLAECPLFLAPGVAVQWFFDSERVSQIKTRTGMISAKIPVNLVYSLRVSESFRIEPYAGVYARFNIWAREKTSFGDATEKVNLLDKDEMGEKAYKPFQLGWNAGVNIRITDAFTIGAGYFMDMNSLAKYSSGEGDAADDVKRNFRGFDITLGLNF